jgi:hypothetical protein
VVRIIETTPHTGDIARLFECDAVLDMEDGQEELLNVVGIPLVSAALHGSTG